MSVVYVNYVKDEGCPQLATYLCQMDYVLADIMHMKLVRTKTIAEGEFLL